MRTWADLQEHTWEETGYLDTWGEPPRRDLDITIQGPSLRRLVFTHSPIDSDIAIQELSLRRLIFTNTPIESTIDIASPMLHEIGFISAQLESSSWFGPITFRGYIELSGVTDKGRISVGQATIIRSEG